MHTHQRIVFGNMGGIPREEKIPETVEEQNYKFNTLVLEIANNWGFVKNIMSSFSSGNLKSVDPMERDWINFIMENQLNFNNYESSDKFVESCLRK